MVEFPDCGVVGWSRGIEAERENSHLWLGLAQGSMGKQCVSGKTCRVFGMGTVGCAGGKTPRKGFPEFLSADRGSKGSWLQGS